MSVPRPGGTATLHHVWLCSVTLNAASPSVICSGDDDGPKFSPCSARSTAPAVGKLVLPRAVVSKAGGS